MPEIEDSAKLMLEYFSSNARKENNIYEIKNYNIHYNSFHFHFFE